jgi:hypothetical protein
MIEILNIDSEAIWRVFQVYHKVPTELNIIFLKK